MSRALPQDLAAIAGSDRALLASPALQLVRWFNWGDDWNFGDSEEQNRDLDAMLVLDHESPLRNVLQRGVDRAHARAAERARELRDRGLFVQPLRAVCSGRVLRVTGDPASGDVGLSLHRALGVPCMAASMVRYVMRLAAEQTYEDAWDEHLLADDAARAQLMLEMYGSKSAEAENGGALRVFDAMPVQVPVVERRKSDLRWNTDNGLFPEEQPLTAMELRRRQTLCVGPDTELVFWLAGPSEEMVNLGARHLQFGLILLGLQLIPVVEEPEPEPAPQSVAPPPPVEEDASSAESDALPTEVPDWIETITIAAQTVIYQPNNGQVSVMFTPPNGRSAMKAIEHINSVAMEESVRKRLKKKKSLTNAKALVEAVGNSWKIRGIKE